MPVSRLPELDRTVRQRLRDLLRREELTAMELSRELGIPEKEVYAHLEHVMRSTSGSGDKIRIWPSECLACGYVFRDRRRPSGTLSGLP